MSSYNVALRVEQGDSPDKFKVSGRGELHLSVLIENMRREGFELGVSRPEVIQKVIDGQLSEPHEMLVIDCEESHQGGVMEELGLRRAELQNLITDGQVGSGWNSLCPREDYWLSLTVPHVDLGLGDHDPRFRSLWTSRQIRAGGPQ